MIGLLGLILKKAFGIQNVVTFHIFAFDKDHVGYFENIYGMLGSIALKNADRVVSAGNRLRHFLDRRYAFSPDHVAEINPGMDPFNIEMLMATDKIRCEVEGETYRLLFIGRLIEKKWANGSSISGQNNETCRLGF